MPAPHWVTRPRQRLPRTVAPFRNESIDSFLRRLASANHLSILELRPYLAGSQNGRPRPDWISTASGWPTPLLIERLQGLTADGPRNRHSGTACRQCMARRNVFERVVIHRPQYINVCLRHQLWIGDIPSPESQLTISALPEVLNAQRTHIRLTRRHGTAAADSAYTTARAITRRWTERYNWPEHRERRLQTSFAHKYEQLLMNSIEIDIANYPEVVALTGILVSKHWRHKAMPHLAGQPSWAPNRTRQQFYAEVGRRLKIDYRPHTTRDPLVAWVNSAEKSSLLQRSFDQTTTWLKLDDNGEPRDRHQI